MWRPGGINHVTRRLPAASRGRQILAGECALISGPFPPPRAPPTLDKSHTGAMTLSGLVRTDAPSQAGTLILQSGKVPQPEKSCAPYLMYLYRRFTSIQLRASGFELRTAPPASASSHRATGIELRASSYGHRATGIEPADSEPADSAPRLSEPADSAPRLSESQRLAAPPDCHSEPDPGRFSCVVLYRLLCSVFMALLLSLRLANLTHPRRIPRPEI
ncbi:hypothetical protein EGW08_020512 [Elysia chlorotica]|uniref:Uncharacterized protein n=1 Tax=Elysia chlorotica TaxID=188477 RepID=A0A433SR45_ELYCH|nr:hypothetical protein EGW08_020512 [Elysia chlorotica]